MRSYGRIHAHDSRDAKYSLHSLRSHRIERFWNGGHVLDQEHSNSCVGQAWAGWLLAPPISGQFLDPLGLYAMAGRFDAGDRFDAAGGTTVRNGAKVLKKLGFIESYHWAHDIDSLIYTL